MSIVWDPSYNTKIMKKSNTIDKQLWKKALSYGIELE